MQKNEKKMKKKKKKWVGSDHSARTQNTYSFALHSHIL